MFKVLVIMDFKICFKGIPTSIIINLEKHYIKIKNKYLQGDFEPSELNGAKFSETIYRLLEWKTTGKHTAFGKHIPNFADKCRKFQQYSKLDDSIRFHIPNALIAIHDIRNKRGVGHTAGDVDPNHMDATFVVGTCDWILAEIVRLFYKKNISTQVAQAIVEKIITKQIPMVWEIFGIKRVLDKKLPISKKTLLLLYAEFPKDVDETKLYTWVEHSNSSIYRRDILISLHKKGMIEYDKKEKKVIISPIGRDFVEKNIPLKVAFLTKSN